MRVWTTHKEYLVVFVIVQNLVGIGVVVLITCNYAWKCLFMPPKYFWGIWPPKWGAVWTRLPKGTHFLARQHIVWCI